NYFHRTFCEKTVCARFSTLRNRHKKLRIIGFLGGRGHCREAAFLASGRIQCLFQESKYQGLLSNFLKRVELMAKRRGNPNWGKPEPIGPVVPVVTSFEQAVKEFKLTPDQYQRSLRLREWARRNKNSKYIPEPLLQAWGFEIENTL